MNVNEAIQRLLGLSEDKISVMLKDGPDDRRLSLDGQPLTLKMPMPNCQGDLLRIGRHLWQVTWITEGGNLIDCKATQLTQGGT